MSNDLKWLRKKTAKGKEYYYFDLGMVDGQRALHPLPHIKDPRFGDCYARARSERTRKKNQQGVLTFEGLMRMYEKSPEFRGLSVNTQKSYLTYLGRADKLMRTKDGASWPAKKIERKDILALRDALSDTPGAASQTVRAVGALYAWAVDNEKVADTPVFKIKKFKATPHEPWPEELLEEALLDPQVAMPVALLFYTGQRINDTARMKWSDIRGDHMLVYQQKKDKHISVAINPALAEMLKTEERKAVTVLTNSNGTPWSHVGLRQKLQLWAKERGHKVVPHGLRKNAVISLLEAGCTVPEVQGITDQSREMVEYYAEKVNRLDLGRAAVVKLDTHRRAKNKGGK